jgi:glycine C-acetyltransferase
MTKELLTFLEKENTHLEHAGLFKSELAMDQKTLIDLGSQDYLGLSVHPLVKSAAIEMIETHGVGLASPRMVTGTRAVHEELETALSRYLGTEDTLLYSSRYHANTGLFESLFDDRDWLFADELIHPSLADGMRLSKARVGIYKSHDMNHLEDSLKRSRAARFRVIVTDGVFPLEGRPAELGEITMLADKYAAQVFVDDTHGVGVMGPRGRGTIEALGVKGEVDLITGSLTSTIGAGSGGFASGKKQIVEWLRQKSRPYLASSAPPPSSAGAALAALRLLEKDLSPLTTLKAKVAKLREGLAAQGFEVIKADHPIVVLMIGHAVAAQRLINALYQRNIYAVGFCHPVVPEGAARIRAQISMRHDYGTIDTVLTGFSEAKRELDRQR